MTEVRQMMESWRHVFKLDPDRAISEANLRAVCQSGTDGILVGGSTGLTYDNTARLLSGTQRYGVPCALEVSDLSAVVPGFDAYMIPMVLNASDPAWIVGHHRAAVERYGDFIPWELLLAEGYIVLNGDSAVARVTGADTGLSAEGAAACAHIADKLMSLPIVYLEYSGRFGEVQTMRAVREAVGHARLFYGGGVAGPDEARLAASLADTV
ncbi:heptaprenylglyceryl phosphate synthase, partial [Paenibacillus forsythiae]|uniref:heptaprenylglyceryl phosphate synthase n=1 Tax=Paenibacillus forsythiae TaxID=365616 RepID=UPI000684C696